MKNILLLLPISLLLLAVSGSCKKKIIYQPTKTELLTSTTWKLEKVTAGITDVTSYIPACSRDNIITFVSNGTGSTSEGASSCTPPVVTTFTWRFQNSETELSLSTSLIPGGSGTFTIITLNETDLVLAQQVTIPSFPLPVSAVITFKH